MGIKMITVLGKSWFDKVNGNSYCSAQVFFDGEQVATVPFTYGYNDYFIQASMERLQKLELIDPEFKGPLWRYCNENKIKLIKELLTNQRKKEVEQWGEL